MTQKTAASNQHWLPETNAEKYRLQNPEQYYLQIAACSGNLLIKINLNDGQYQFWCSDLHRCALPDSSSFQELASYLINKYVHPADRSEIRNKLSLTALRQLYDGGDQGEHLICRCQKEANYVWRDFYIWALPDSSAAPAVILLFLNSSQQNSAKYYDYLQHIRLQQLLDNRTTKDEDIKNLALAYLNEQIKPHFLNNTLASIKALISIDPEQAEESILFLSDFINNQANFMTQNDFIPFPDIIENIDNYLMIEKIRFGQRLQIKYDYQFLDFLFPAMILQPLIENAIKHGISSKAEGGTITLRSAADENHVMICVIDDGMGISSSSTPSARPDRCSIGLNNARCRLQLLLDGKMQITSEPGCGTCIQIIVDRSKVTAGALLQHSQQKFSRLSC